MGQVSNLIVKAKAGKIRCVVFDFDGVLVDSNEIKRKAYFEIFAPFGDITGIVEGCLADKRTGNRYQVLECILGGLKAIGILNPDEFAPNPLMHFAEKYNSICETYANYCKEIPGASDCLTRLSERYGLYVNSTTLQQPLRRIIRHRGWERYFTEVLGSPQTKIENLKWIMERESVTGDEVVFVGDSEVDLAAARTFGCHFVGIRNIYSDLNSSSLIILDTLNGLENAILQIRE